MPRQLLKRILPARARLREQWFLRPFSALLHDPALWATHRKNVLKAFAVGLIVCFVPIPGQMAVAAVAALWIRTNIAVAVATSWLANPVTVGPVYYSAYRVGAWLLDEPSGRFHVELSIDWLTGGLLRLWQPLLLGCLVLGTVTTVTSVFVLNRIWIASSRHRFRSRRRRAVAASS